MFSGPFDHSIIKRAKNNKIVEINFVNIRNFGIGKHKVVDDKPYGGGLGMILKVDVLEKAIENTKDLNLNKKSQRIVLLGPHGKTFNQKKARDLSKLEHLILICGHYEGVDERIKEFIDEEISIGDFVVTGGEIPAMLIVDAVTRLQIGVLKQKVIEIESFSPLLEYPQYTRPEIYKNISVPKVLTRGNHKKILDWRNKTSIKKTSTLRPDIIKSIINPQRD